MFAVALMFALLPGIAFGADAKPDLDLLDRYLDRADEARTEAEWTALSESGEAAVIARWESAMLFLADAGVDYAALKTEAASEIKDAVERRLSAWLMDRFFASNGDADLSGILNGMKRSALAAIFELDGKGAVRLDAEGDPIQREHTGDAAVETEVEAWKDSARGLEDQAIADWETRSTEAFAELLSGLSPRARANLETVGTARLADYGASLRREADAMLALEESNFRYLRLKDQYSLRLESEGKGAESVVDELVGKAGVALEAGLKNLTDGLDAEAGAVTANGEPIDGDEWQERFRDELDKGLALWEKAGEDFIAQRVEWEQRAGKDLASGIDEWNAALRELQERESAWLDEFQTVRERAEAQYDRRFAEIDRAQKEARMELDASVAANEGNLTERIEVTVGALDQSLEMMKTARESAGYWISKTDGNAGFSIDSVSWEPNALRKELLAAMFACAGSRQESRSYGSASFGPSHGMYEPEDVWGYHGPTESMESTESSFQRANERALRELQAYIGAGTGFMPSDAELEALVSRGARAGTLSDYAAYQRTVTDFCREKLTVKADEIYRGSLDQRLSDTEKATVSGNLSALVEDCLGRISGALTVSSNARGDDAEALSQATYWVETVYQRYAAEAESQNKDLAKSYGLVVFEGKDIPAGGYASGQTIAGPIEALDAHGWEAVYLDSYQVELLEARAVSDYWGKELAVAKAVYDYSVDESSSRQTEAETLREYQAACDGYTAALAAYRASVADLSAINGALDGKNAAIDAIKTRLGEAKAKLADAKTRYANLLTLAELDNADYYTGQFRSYYEAISRLRGASSGSVSESAAKLASSAATYANESFVKVSSEALERLIQGDATSDAKAEGVIDLKRQYDARASFTVDPTKFDDGTFLTAIAKDLAIAADDPWFATIKEAYERHGGVSMDASATHEFSRFLETAAATLAAEASGTLERRMMAVSLLLSGTASDAYAAVAKLTPGARLATSLADGKTLLEESERSAEFSLLAKRLDVELPALEALIAELDAYKDAHGDSLEGFSAAAPGSSTKPSEDLAWTLWRILGADRGLAGAGIASYSAECRDTLKSIQTILGAVTGVDERSRALRSLAASNRLAADYLSGKTVFSSDGVDYAIPYLSSEYAATVALSGAAEEYRSYAALSPGLQVAQRTEAVAAFSSWVSANGLGSVSGGVLDLKSPTLLWQSFNPSSAADAVEQIARVSHGAEAVLADERLPAYFRQGIESWLSELSTLFTYRAARSFGTGSLAESAARKTEADALTKECADFDRVSGTFCDPETSAENRAVAALWLISSGTTLSETAGEVAADALAVSFCKDRLAYDGAEVPSWESRYDAWFDSLKADDPSSACRAYARDRVIARAEALWEKARLRGDAGYDYAASANKETLDGIKLVEALNASPPEEFLAQFAANSDAIKYDALALYRVDRYLESASGGAQFGVADAYASLYYGGDVAAASAALPGVMAGEGSERKAAYGILCGLSGEIDKPSVTNVDAKATFGSFAARFLATSRAAVTDNPYLADVFSGLYYASLDAALSENTDEERSGALAVLTETTGIAANPAIDLAAFSASGLDGRALAGYACADASRMSGNAAYRYALKARILAGKDVSSYLIGADEGLADELERFERVVSATYRYVPPLDGSFSAYLETLSSSDLREAERADASLFNALGWFHDPYFETGREASGTKAYLDAEATRLSGGLTAIANAAETTLAAGYANRSAAASLALARVSAGDTYERLSGSEDGAWRSYLGAEGIMTHAKNAALLDDTTLGFTACEAVADLRGETAGSCVYYGANAQVNNGLESAQRLTALSSALKSWLGAWYSSDPSDAANAYVRANSALASADLRSGSLSPAFESFKSVGVSASAASAFQRDAQAYYARVGQQTALSKSMTNLGATIADYNANKNRSAAAMTGAAKDRIIALQSEIGAIEAEWAKAIDDPSISVEALTTENLTQAGYRQLEAAYDLRYGAAQRAFERLDAAKQASKTAKAIYDYASTPYLRSTNALQDVDPDTHLAAVRDHVRRAAAAVSALEGLYDAAEQKKTLYDRDPEYARLKNAYASEYRARLASMQAQTLLETEIKNAQAQYDRAKLSYESTVKSIDGARTLFAETDATGSCAVSVHDWLTGLRESLSSDQLKILFDKLRVSDGEVSFSGSGAQDETAIAGYFTRGKDEPLSKFERDLASWMERNSGVDVGLWSSALSWEEFTRAGGLTYDQYLRRYPAQQIPTQYQGQTTTEKAWDIRKRYGAFVSAILKRTSLARFGGTSGDEDIDKAITAYCSGCDDLDGVLQSLESSYGQVASSRDYAFFKLLAFCNAARIGANTAMESFVNCVCAQAFYEDSRYYCQGRGTKSVDDKPAWHNARDDAVAKRDEAARLYHENNGYLNTTASLVPRAAAYVAEAKAALMALTGVDPESGVGSVSFDMLVSAVIAASGRNSTCPINDILKTAGIENAASLSAAQKEEALRRVLSSNGLISTTGAYAGMGDMLSALVAAHGDRVASADEGLSAYLYAGGTFSGKEGLAVKQEKSEASYDAAYTAFVAHGILPDAVATKNVISGWEAILAPSGANQKVRIGAIANAAREYLAKQGETEAEDGAVSDLRLAWSAYQKALETGGGTVDAEEALADAFSSLTSGYETGVGFLNALDETYDRRGETVTSGHVYDERENSIRAYELYEGILGDLSSEGSYVHVVGLSDVTDSLKQSLLALNAGRLASYAEVHMGEWDILRQELTEEKSQYDAQMDAILSRGRSEWRKGVNTLAVAQETWEKSFERGFAEKETLWDNQYLAFLDRKNAWATDLVAQAVNVGDRAMLGLVPELTADYVREASDFIISDVVERPNPSCIIHDVLDENLLSGLIGGGKKICCSLMGFAPVIFQTLKRDTFTNAEILGRVREYQTRNDDELQARLAYIQYDKALQALGAARGEVEESVKDSNKSAWKGFRDMLLDDGFKQDGENFSKETTVGATFRDNLYETHTITGFADFVTDVRDFTKDFAVPEGLSPETLGFDALQAILKKAMDCVPKEYARIFGERDDDGNWVGASYERQYLQEEQCKDAKQTYDEAAKTYVSYLVTKTREVTASDTSITADAYKNYQDNLAKLGAAEQGESENRERILVRGNGLFNEWVGYAPVMRADADAGVDIDDYAKNVQFAGSGETGRIMGMFIQHKMIEGAGQAEARRPAYDRRLWDDRGSWMSAPSIRTLTDISTSIAAAVIAPGATHLLLNQAINLMDDAMFAVMDVNSGLDMGTSFGAFGQKVATSSVTSRLGAGFSKTGGFLSSTMLGDGVIGTSLTKGLEITMTNTASGAINAFSLRSFMKGDDCFDEDAFRTAAFGKGAMASVAAGMAGNAVTVGLGKVNLTDANKDPLTKLTFDTANIQGYNTLMGNLVGSAVTYGLTGNARFNVARFKGIGLMEINLGKDGFGMNAGMGGTDISLGTLSGAMTGYQESRKVLSWKFGDNEQRSTLNAINLLGCTGELGNAQNVGVSRAIWSGKLKATYQDMANGVNGYYDRKVDANEIVLSSEFLGGGREAAAKLATDMSHEGSHWSGNHIEALAQEQGAVTYAEINAMFGLPTDSQFAQTMVDAYNNPDSWKVNEEGREHWRVTKDKNGKVVKVQDDGDRNTITIVNDDGTKDTVARDYSMGLSQQIAKINGNESKAGVKAINAIMWKSGLDYKASQCGWFARNSEGVYTKTYLDYEYPGIKQKLNQETQRKQEESAYRAEIEKQNAINRTSSLWGNLAQQDVSSIFMQDLGETAMLGNTTLPVYTNGCQLVAGIRGMNSLGKNIALFSAASDAANFDKNGGLMHTFFTNQGIDLIGPIQGDKSIHDTLEMLKSFDKPYALIGAAKFGDGYHSVSINQVYIAPSGNYEVECYETSSTGLSQGRKYGLAAANRKNYYQISKLYYMYKRN